MFMYELWDTGYGAWGMGHGKPAHTDRILVAAKWWVFSSKYFLRLVSALGFRETSGGFYFLGI